MPTSDFYRDLLAGRRRDKLAKAIQNSIQFCMDLCAEIAAARRENGLSQQELASRLGVTREKLARLELGSGKVELLLRVMDCIPVRLSGVARGDTLIEQLENSRQRSGANEHDIAAATALDARTVIAVLSGAGTMSSLQKIFDHLAPKARRQPPTPTFWGQDRAKTAQTDSRFTPMALLDAITDAFGVIELDPCSHPTAPIKATRKIMLPDDGLSADWSTAGLVYLNPPFSNLGAWLAKANDEWEAGKTGRMVFLLPTSRFDLKEFNERTVRAATTLILKKRLRFGSPDQPETGHQAPFAIALTCWGCAEDDLRKFQSAFPALVLERQD